MDPALQTIANTRMQSTVVGILMEEEMPLSLLIAKGFSGCSSLFVACR